MTEKEIAENLVDNFLSQLGLSFSDMKDKINTGMGGEDIKIQSGDFLDLVDQIEEELKNY